ncbi:Uncharacterised protein [Streptococcus pneumoniae]|uniref:Uncharacterized protein n=2 Tax=Streptococcus pneumoniae TaxID=1313 RepID=D6CHP3_STREE|nr:hypothetical protein [Streptococcus pneumoniae]EHD87877.1 hypothetical protein SPAR22_0519 [Streptococcus pneumoniae GA11304]ADM91204.1 hypothetical protein SP670_1141 [Streptococcus pneumoniae 670-6B]KWX82561.1 hypothetical protein AWW74_11960 [Streptococcus pneumoniae]KXB95048.1 hypothetical protein AXF24_11930 [Streptococcus pneumoniae]MBW4999172.1 hypothetical protein [Streptococcus pneumoniae]
MTTTKNPWNDILTTTHKGKEAIVARDDWEIIQTILESENKNNSTESTELHLNFYPQQFVGNVKNADVIILSKNPRYTEGYEELYNNNKDYQQTCLDSLQLKKVVFHAFKLDEGDELGYTADKFKFWFEDAGMGEQFKTNKDYKEHVDWFTKHIALAEFFPYHSDNYNREISKIVEEKGYLPTQQFLFNLIKERIADKSKPPVTILIARGYAEWTNAIPELKTYEKCYRSSNPRNATIRAKHLLKGDGKAKIYATEEFSKTLSKLFKDL